MGVSANVRWWETPKRSRLSSAGASGCTSSHDRPWTVRPRKSNGSSSSSSRFTSAVRTRTMRSNHIKVGRAITPW